jgi:hypothetical protein
MFSQLSMSATELMLRRAALVILESAAARDAAERRARCGRVCSIEEFEQRTPEEPK